MRLLLLWASSALEELLERSGEDSALSRQWLALELRGRLDRPRRLLATALHPCAELGAGSGAVIFGRGGLRREEAAVGAISAALDELIRLLRRLRASRERSDTDNQGNDNACSTAWGRELAAELMVALFKVSSSL